MVFAARFALRLLAAGGLALVLAAGAQGETAKKAGKEKAGKDPAAKPALVATYGDWSVFHSQSGKSRICYTLAQPKSRDPEDPKRDPAYAFISERPTEGVRNEVSFIMGFEVAAPGGSDAKEKKKSDVKDTAEKKDKTEAKAKAKNRKEKVDVVSPTAMIGDVELELLPKGSDLWVKNAAKESQLIEEMRKGAQLKIKAAAKKGGVTEDTYSLTGFSQAIDRAIKDCPGA